MNSPSLLVQFPPTMLNSLCRNCGERSQDDDHVLRTIKLEPVLTDREVLFLLEVLIELTVNSGHLSERTNPRRSIARGSREEEVSHTSRDRNGVDGLGSNRRKVIADIDIKTEDIEPELKS